MWLSRLLFTLMSCEESKGNKENNRVRAELSAWVRISVYRHNRICVQRGLDYEMDPHGQPTHPPTLCQNNKKKNTIHIIHDVLLGGILALLVAMLLRDSMFGGWIPPWAGAYGACMFSQCPARNCLLLYYDECSGCSPDFCPVLADTVTLH